MEIEQISRRSFLSAAVLLVGCSHTTKVSLAETDTTKDLREYVVKFLDDFNSGDPELFKSHFHFPHTKISTPNIEWIDDSKESLIDYEKLRQTGWVESISNEIEVMYATKDKGLVRLNFSRIDKDGNVILTTDSIYTLTKIEGKWGIAVLFIGMNDLPLN